MNDDFDCSCAACQNIDQPVVHEVCGCYECHDTLNHDLQDWSDVCDECWTIRFNENN